MYLRFMIMREQHSHKRKGTNMDNYKGWKIIYRPIGGQHWRAEQYGVGMCANSVDLLKRMIDRRIAEGRDK